VRLTVTIPMPLPAAAAQANPIVLSASVAMTPPCRLPRALQWAAEIRTPSRRPSLSRFTHRGSHGSVTGLRRKCGSKPGGGASSTTRCHRAYCVVDPGGRRVVERKDLFPDQIGLEMAVGAMGENRLDLGTDIRPAGLECDPFVIELC